MYSLFYFFLKLFILTWFLYDWTQKQNNKGPQNPPYITLTDETPKLRTFVELQDQANSIAFKKLGQLKELDLELDVWL